MAYVRLPAVMAKLDRAAQSFCPVIMLAPAGWGKTAAVRHYYRNKPALWLSGLSGRLSEAPPIQSIRQSVVIVDDVSWLEDEASQQYVLDLLRQGGRQVLLLGRGRFPAWLAPVAFEVDFVRVTHRDLAMQGPQIQALFEESGVPLSAEAFRLIETALHGYPPAVCLCLRHAEQGQSVDRAMFAEIRIELFHYYEKAFYQLWKPPVQEMLLTLCPFSSFSPEMAEYLTGSPSIPEYLEYCRGVGSFLERRSPTCWVLLDDLRAFLQWKQALVWPRERILENYRKAASFYEMRDQLSDALACYDLAGATEQIRQTLIHDAQRHPGVGQYYELRKYYELLPRESVLESPVLMAGMSVLCSMTMRPEEAEEWYRALDAFEKDPKRTPEERREARVRLAYLEIGLPHRAGRGLIGILRRLYTMHLKDDIALPELSVTDNLPSVINGGLDFCDWARNAGQIARFMQKPVEALLGRYGKGLVNIALAESGFERGDMSPYEVITRLSNGYAAANHGGRIEICFAAEGVMARQHIAEGQLPTARRQFETFREKAEEAGARQLFPNMDAFGAWLALYSGDLDVARGWLETAPDEQADFCIMDRFRYMVKLRCLIADDRLADAMRLASYLTHYFETYRRTYLWIENEYLKAMILYRQGAPEWRTVFEGALKRAREYRFIRVAAMEGGVMLPLLTEMDGSSSPDAFRQEVTAACRQMALRYPDYLKFIPRVEVRLTKREQQILSMLCSGSSTEEICQVCGITYSGLKKHNRSIYAKLGVKTRVEAERTAARLGLIQRKGNNI